MLARKPRMLVTVAVANNMARMVWALQAKGGSYRAPVAAAPPPGTKSGVTRYEAWRLPPAESEAGFVSVALVSDMDAGGDTFDRVDEWARKWAEAQSRGSGRRRR